MKFLRTLLALTFLLFGLMSMASPVPDAEAEADPNPVPDFVEKRMPQKKAPPPNAKFTPGPQTCKLKFNAPCRWGPGPGFPVKHMLTKNTNVKLQCYLVGFSTPPANNFWDWVPLHGCYVNEAPFDPPCVLKVTNLCPWGTK